MDEARRVLERLERIEALRRGEANAGTLLAELRGLLADGEAWLAVEGARADGADGAAAALERCRERIEQEGEVRPREGAAAG